VYQLEVLLMHVLLILYVNMCCKYLLHLLLTQFNLNIWGASVGDCEPPPFALANPKAQNSEPGEFVCLWVKKHDSLVDFRAKCLRSTPCHNQ